MLLNLHVKNLALIEEVDVDFEKGLIVLTGETGAGKSLILGSVNIALGNKASKDMIRKGTDYSLVELTFSVSENCAKQLKKYDIYMEEDNIITVTRKISEGRSISKINGETVNIKTLKNVMSLLIDIHGQHDHQSLLYTKNHLDILDKFAKDSILELKEQIMRIREIGGIPLMIADLDMPEEITALEQLADGLLLSGGGDVDPKWFGETDTQSGAVYDEKRDRMEIWLCRAFAAAKKWL